VHILLTCWPHCNQTTIYSSSPEWNPSDCPINFNFYRRLIIHTYCIHMFSTANYIAPAQYKHNIDQCVSIIYHLWDWARTARCCLDVLCWQFGYYYITSEQLNQLCTHFWFVNPVVVTLPSIVLESGLTLITPHSWILIFSINLSHVRTEYVCF